MQLKQVTWKHYLQEIFRWVLSFLKERENLFLGQKMPISDSEICGFFSIAKVRMKLVIVYYKTRVNEAKLFYIYVFMT